MVFCVTFAAAGAANWMLDITTKYKMGLSFRRGVGPDGLRRSFCVRRQKKSHLHCVKAGEEAQDV
ncbi:hypothetical protein PI125_g8113 [Phytophthora idaei]|nr:hypothetical protein PI125_g8113 [Phytophthora idaei]